MVGQEAQDGQRSGRGRPRKPMKIADRLRISDLGSQIAARCQERVWLVTVNTYSSGNTRSSLHDREGHLAAGNMCLQPAGKGGTASFVIAIEFLHAPLDQADSAASSQPPSDGFS